jgi:hypothetical protein
MEGGCLLQLTIRHLPQLLRRRNVFEKDNEVISVQYSVAVWPMATKKVLIRVKYRKTAARSL